MRFKTLVILALTLALSGCRLGNREEPLKPTDDNGGGSPAPEETWSGYYETEVQTVEFCANLTNSPSTSCAMAQLVPALLQTYFTNPLAFLVQNISSGSAGYFDPFHPGDADGNLPLFPVTIDLGNGNVTSNTGFTDQVAWLDEACTRKRQVGLNGKLLKGPIKLIGNVPTQGRSEHTVQYYEEYDGDCAQSLALMAACYDDLNQCGGSTATENQLLNGLVRDRFAYVIATGVLSSADLPNLSAFGYEVSYK